MTEWIPVIVYLLALTGVGAAIVYLMLRGRTRLEAELWLPIGFAMALGLQGVSLFVSQILLSKVSLLFPIAAAILVVAAALVLFMKEGESKNPLGGFGLADAPRDPNARGAYWAAAGLIVLLFSIVYSNAASYPFTSYDGRAIWTFKAKILLEERTLNSEAFTDPYRVQYHRDYPQMFPIAQFVIASIYDRIPERQIRFLFSTTFVYTVLFLFGLIRHLGGRSLAMYMALLYCATPFRDDWAERDGGALNSGAVDLPLGFLCLVSVSFYYLWWKERHRWRWVIAAIFGGLCLMTKKEGLIIVAATFGANFFYALFGVAENKLRAMGEAIGGAIMSFLVASPWFLASRHIPNLYDEDFLAMVTPEVLTTMYTRLPIIFYNIGSEMMNFGKWNFYWVVFPIVVLVGVRGWFRRKEFYFDAVLMLWLAAYLLTYLLSPLNLVFHLQTSISRLLSHMLPCVLVRMALLVVDYFPHAESAPESAEARASNGRQAEASP